jgi:tRNA/rRNA methyltransferase
MFGRERNGLENDEVALADQIITLPVNPAFASLNLAQAVVIVAYEWFKHMSGGALPFSMPLKSQAAPRQQLLAFFANLERELENVEFFRPPDKRETMQINLRNIFSRMQPTQQDIQTLNGVIMAIAEGRKGPARGGILDSEEASALRALLTSHPEETRGADAPVRGLAKFLRRNPTDGERALWGALTTDRRFSGLFKRQTPVGPHINDFVSFQQRLVIDIVPDGEGEAGAKARAEKHTWLQERGYQVVTIRQAALSGDLSGVLDSLAAAMTGPL